MDNNKERNLTLINNPETCENTDKKQKISCQTNPIAKKLLEFHHEKIKFSVKDLFIKNN